MLQSLQTNFIKVGIERNTYWFYHATKAKLVLHVILQVYSSFILHKQNMESNVEG